MAKRLRALAGSPGSALYRDGSARFELDEAVLTITPPFGLEHEGEYDVLRVEPLLEALETEPTVAVLLVRMGGYAVGVFEGEQLVASKVGTRFVKGRHKKGGSSANRFRRRREEQERELIDAAAEEAARVLGPWRERVEHVALGGDRTAVVARARSARRPGLAAAARARALLRRRRPPPARARGAAVPALRSEGRGRAGLAVQVRDRGSVGGVALAAVDERVLVELVADCRADGPGGTAVDDAHAR